MSLTQTRKHRYTCGTAAQPTMDAQPELPRRESASTTLAQDTYVSFDERSFKLTTLAVESFGRLGEEGYEFIDELATHACRGRERWGIDGTERGLQGTTSSGHFGGYTGGHLPQSPAVQAVTTRTSTRGGVEKSRTSVEHINTSDLGLEC